jgi:L-alanine-DL-glutamate epimerase-like enolase superfamily enzyme
MTNRTVGPGGVAPGADGGAASGLGPLRIRAVRAIPLCCPLGPEHSHTSDFGRQDRFDAVLVAVETDQGVTGYGEAKAAVGSAASTAALCAAVEGDLGPALAGRDARDVVGLWEAMYCGPREGHALRAGWPMPGVDRRGTRVAALGGIDIALWDAWGRYAGLPVHRLLGGRLRPRVRCYASGGWAGPEAIGEELQRYREWGGFTAFKMRVGAMDGGVGRALARVAAARRALGEGPQLLADAHGTLTVPEARAFCARAADADVAWLEEPTPVDDLAAMAEVRRASSGVAIAAGESEVTRFGFRDLILVGGADVLQPDPAICGGLTEAVRIAALAGAHLRVVVPHLWGTAVLFAAGLQLAAACPNVPMVEYPMGGNPALHGLAEPAPRPVGGEVEVPEGPGLGVRVLPEFVARYRIDGRHGLP